MAGDDGPPLHRGSCLCSAYELRITERCLVDDLGLSADGSFEEALAHPIVQAFVDKRQSDPDSGKTVGPAAGRRTLRHLGRGDDHRGSTWFDRKNGVVWLTAYGFHRSGDPEDAFQKFDQLIAADAMRPTTQDYRRLGRDRAGRFVELAPMQATSAVHEVIAREGDVIEVDLAQQLRVRLFAMIAEGVVELTITFPWGGLNQDRIFFIVRCFEGSSNDLYEVADSFGGDPVAEGELGFVIWRDPPAS
jgi:hypothetical protein